MAFPFSQPIFTKPFLYYLPMIALVILLFMAFAFFLSVVFSLPRLLLNGFELLHNLGELTILLLFKSWNALLEACHILAYLAEVGLESSFGATFFDLTKDNAVIDSINFVGDICTACFNGALSYLLHGLEVTFPSRNIRCVLIRNYDI